MKNEKEFWDGFKIGLGLPQKGTITIILYEAYYNMNELAQKVVEYFINKNHICSYLGLSAGNHTFLLDGDKYALRSSAYGAAFSYIPCQQIILIPVD